MTQAMAQDAAQVDVAYENIMSDPMKELKMLADTLDVGDKVLAQRTSVHDACPIIKVLTAYCSSQAAVSSHRFTCLCTAPW